MHSHADVLFEFSSESYVFVKKLSPTIIIWEQKISDANCKQLTLRENDTNTAMIYQHYNTIDTTLKTNGKLVFTRRATFAPAILL